jgi:hypothetical protein
MLTTLWIAAGCGAAAQGEQPVARAAAVVGQTAPPAPAICDQAVAPAIAILDTSACKGVMPAKPACAARIAACVGVTTSDLGPHGAAASLATSDSQGSVSIECTSADGTPSPGSALFAPAARGFGAGVHLGDGALPLPSGFVATASSTNGHPPPDVLFFDHQGTQLASHSEGFAIVGPAGVEIATVLDDAVVLQQFGFGGTARGAQQTVGPASGGVILGGATDSLGHTLVIFGTYGQPVTMARWFAPDGTPETALFQISGWAQNIGTSAALPGGGVAVGGAIGPRWRSVMTAGSTVEESVPPWLSSRGSFVPVRGGRALAFGTEIVASNGISCGSIDIGSSQLLGIGRDGTVVTTDDGANATVYPRLLQ